MKMNFQWTRFLIFMTIFSGLLFCSEPAKISAQDISAPDILIQNTLQKKELVKNKPSKNCPQESRDDVWLISSRALNPCADGDFSSFEISAHLNYWRLSDSPADIEPNLKPTDSKSNFISDSRATEKHFIAANACCPQWETSDREAFLRTLVPNQPVIFVVHGNWTSDDDAILNAEFVRTALRQIQNNNVSVSSDSPNSSNSPNSSVLSSSSVAPRLVIWSWPSERTYKKIRRDAQVKAERSICDGQTLGSLIAQMPENQPISLIGFSFGARLIASSLDTLAHCPQNTVNFTDNLAKNEEDSAALDISSSSTAVSSEKSSFTRPIRVLFLAAALDSDAFCPGGMFEDALPETEGFLNFFNPRDKVLKWYPLLYGHGGPKALGVLPFPCPASVQMRVRQSPGQTVQTNNTVQNKNTVQTNNINQTKNTVQTNQTVRMKQNEIAEKTTDSSLPGFAVSGQNNFGQNNFGQKSSTQWNGISVPIIKSYCVTGTVGKDHQFRLLFQSVSAGQLAYIFFLDK